MSANALAIDLYFAAVLSACGNSASTRLRPVADLMTPLAPHKRFAPRMLLALQALGYIEPELSPSWAEDWLAPCDWLSRGFENLSWRVLRPSSVAKQSLLAWAEDGGTVQEALRTWTAVWADLALAEAASHASASLAAAGFNPHWADTAAAALGAGVKEFGVDKMMYLIHIALRSTALAHQRGNVDPTRPGGVFATSLQNYVKRASAEGWTMRGMTHTGESPSTIAVLFADEVTALGKRYYTERPSLEALVDAMQIHRFAN